MRKATTLNTNLRIRLLASEPSTWQKGKAVVRNTLLSEGMTVGEYFAVKCEGFTLAQRESHLLYCVQKGRIALDEQDNVA